MTSLPDDSGSRVLSILCPMRQIEERGSMTFLIRIGDLFVSGLEKDGKPLCVAVPSAAKHCDYRLADRLCQVLRTSGFQAFVCDLLGEPASLDVLQRELSQQAVA